MNRYEANALGRYLKAHTIARTLESLLETCAQTDERDHALAAVRTLRGHLERALRESRSS